MAVVMPFRGLRPRPDFAEKIAAPPYDVINSDEARQLSTGNPYSFLHINKPEIDLPPDTDLYDPAVYAQGAVNLEKFINEKILLQDEKPAFYLYRQKMDSHEQTGLVACVSTDEYKRDKIKKHELTRLEKEDDRLNHILSFGQDIIWRKKASTFLPRESDLSLLDIATGTADQIISIFQQKHHKKSLGVVIFITVK